MGGEFFLSIPRIIYNVTDAFSGQNEAFAYLKEERKKWFLAVRSMGGGGISKCDNKEKEREEEKLSSLDKRPLIVTLARHNRMEIEHDVITTLLICWKRERKGKNDTVDICGCREKGQTRPHQTHIVKFYHHIHLSIWAEWSSSRQRQQRRQRTTAAIQGEKNTHLVVFVSLFASDKTFKTVVRFDGEMGQNHSTFKARERTRITHADAL